MPSETRDASVMLNQIHDRIDLVCDILKIDERVNSLLKGFEVFKRPFRLTLPKLDPDPNKREIIWTTEQYEVIRVRHINPWATGQQPFGGGLRFDLSVTEALMKVDAFKMTLKHTLVGPNDHVRVPFGGAKGGVAVDPRKFTAQEKVLLTQAVVQKLNPVIGPHVDRLAPDMGTDEVIMDEFMTHYAALNASKNIPCGAIATGKSLANFGCEGRLMATAAGMYDVFNFFRTHPAYQSYFTQPLTAIVAGCGNVGGWFLRLAKENGISVVGLADITGAIWRARGGLETEADAILRWIRDHGGLAGYPEAEVLSLQELLTKPCAILVPAANEGMITPDIAKRMHARILLQGANNPVDNDAVPILQMNDVLNIPDILANAGGAIVSYFEWLQTVQGKQFTREDIAQSRRDYLTGGAKRTVEAVQKYGKDLETGAMIAAIDFINRRTKRKHHWD